MAGALDESIPKEGVDNMQLLVDKLNALEA